MYQQRENLGYFEKRRTQRTGCSPPFAAHGRSPHIEDWHQPCYRRTLMAKSRTEFRRTRELAAALPRRNYPEAFRRTRRSAADLTERTSMAEALQRGRRRRDEKHMNVIKTLSESAEYSNSRRVFFRDTSTDIGLVPHSFPSIETTPAKRGRAQKEEIALYHVWQPTHRAQQILVRRRCRMCSWRKPLPMGEAESS